MKSPYKLTALERHALTGDDKRVLKQVARFAHTGNAVGIKSLLPEIQSAVGRNKAIAKPLMAIADQLKQNSTNAPVITAISLAAAPKLTERGLRSQAARDMIEFGKHIPDAGRAIEMILAAPRVARNDMAVKREAAFAAVQFINSPQLNNAEKKIGYAMTIASYAREAGGIPVVQDRASAAILDAAPKVHSAARRHEAVNFAFRHATTQATRDHALGMQGGQITHGAALPHAPVPSARHAPHHAPDPH